MIQLKDSLKAWETGEFNGVLKREIEELDAVLLPLQQALSLGNYTNDNNFSVLILSTAEEANMLQVKTGIIYKGMITGCSCADDPTPMDEHTEYCEVLFNINKSTAETTVTLLPG